MTSALIGHTGFVGGNLDRQARFDARFNSTNIEEIRGTHWSLLAISGMPGAKWLANRNPEADRSALDRLTGCLAATTADHVVLISTVDVYPQPRGVDENAPIDRAAQHPYGRHRLELEDFVAGRFRSVVIARLPGLFGEGLKKNAIYDLLHGNDIQKIHADAAFQFYGLDRLWRDLELARSRRLDVVNFATEPVRMSEVAEEAFGFAFENRTDAEPPRYDFRTRHAGVFGGAGGYMMTRDAVMHDLRAFVARERARA
jgi:hypothetical protein